MNNSSAKPIQSGRSLPAGRYILGALLLAAFALVIFGGFTQDAQAQGEINDIGILAGNFVLNGSFETDSNGDGIPNNWFDNDALSSADKRVCNQSYAGSCSFKMAGDGGGTKWLAQCISPTGTAAGNEFKFKAWTKTKSLMIGGGEASLYVSFYDGGNFVNEEVFSIPGGTTGWTSRQLSATAAADYDTICMLLQLEASSGKIWFDKATLKYVGGP